MSFRAGNDVLSWVDSLADKEGISRSVVLGHLFEPILQGYVGSDFTLNASVCWDENLKNKTVSQMSFRTSAELIARVDGVAENEELSRSAVLGLLFSAASRDPAMRNSTQRRVVLRSENKRNEFNPISRETRKASPVRFKAAVNEARIAAGFDEGKEEAGNKEDSIFSWILKGLAWLGGALLVVAIASSGKTPGESPKSPDSWGPGGF